MTSTIQTPAHTYSSISDGPKTARRLVARTVPLPDGFDVDFFSVADAHDAVLWHGESFALAGRGEAGRLILPAGLDDPVAVTSVLETLRAIPSDDHVGRPGCGPIVLGALPFDRTAPAALSIPSVTVGRDASGHRWLTTVGPAGQEIASPEALLSHGPPSHTHEPNAFSLTSCRSHEDWTDMVGATVASLRAGHLRKVVLAREVKVVANCRLIPAEILRRLHSLYPSCMVFSTGTFLGASPELLVSKMGRRIRSHPLAGTVTRSGDPGADAVLTQYLMTSAKERTEHRIVVDQVASALDEVCRDLSVPEVPSIVALRNVSHLGTAIEGELDNDDITALDLVCRLHPTPAVAGSPTDTALRHLRAVEGFDRGCYSGPVGWMDGRGDGEWAIAVRSAEVLGNTARLFAGVGLVADSDPASELEETQLKLQALLAAIVRP